jgi:hypothetical protein
MYNFAVIQLVVWKRFCPLNDEHALGQPNSAKVL